MELVVAHKCRDFQSVTGRRARNALGTEAAIVVRVKSPFGLHPKGLGLRSLSQVVMRGRRPRSSDAAARSSLHVRDLT